MAIKDEISHQKALDPSAKIYSDQGNALVFWFITVNMDYLVPVYYEYYVI